MEKEKETLEETISHDNIENNDKRSDPRTLTLNHLLEEINKIPFKEVHLDGP